MPWNYVNKYKAVPIAPPVSDISLATWLDVSDTTSYELAANTVTRWRDKVSNRWFAQPDVNRRPLLVNSVFPVPAIDFTDGNGTNKWMRLESNQTITAPSPTEAYIVHYWTNPTSSYAAWAIFNGSSSGAIESAAGIPYYMVFRSPPAPYSYQYYQGGSTFYYSTNVPTVPGKNIATLYSAPVVTNSRAYRNGIEMPTGFGGSTIGSTDSFTTIGSSDNLYRSHGVIAELLIYTRVLTPEERASTVEYLTTKWGAMTP